MIGEMITQSQKTCVTNRNENVLTGHFKEQKSNLVMSKVSPLFYLTIHLANNWQSVSMVARIMCNMLLQKQ